MGLIGDKWAAFVQSINRRYSIGMRVIKTVLSAMVCLLISLFLDGSNIMSVSTVSAIITMRPSQKDTIHVALARTIGTLLGGLMGLTCMLLGQVIPYYAQGLYAILIPAFMLLDMYICNVLNLQDSAVISCVVVLLVATHVNIPLNETVMYAVYRVIDTMIGVIVATCINLLIAPRSDTKAPPSPIGKLGREVYQSDDLRIRFVVEADMPALLGMMRALAEENAQAQEALVSAEQLHVWLFEMGQTEGLIAEEQGNPVGFAIFVRHASVFLEESGLHIEHIYVHPESREKGYVGALMRALAGVTVQRGYARMDWMRPAVDCDGTDNAYTFMEHVETGGQCCMLEGEALQEVADQAACQPCGI